MAEHDLPLPDCGHGHVHPSADGWISPNITPPKPVYSGSVDDLMAYSVVAGRIYGPKRGARLQGYPAAAELPFKCVTLQHGLADAVPYPLAMAWAKQALQRRQPREEQMALELGVFDRG